MSKTSRKTGFTLVELLVVIAIIGILVGLLVPVIGAASRRVSEFAINNDVNELERALELFNGEFEFYPPDMSEITTAQQFLPFLNKISRNHREGNGSDGGGLEIWWENVGRFLDNESALVFWLSGISADASFPLTFQDPALTTRSPLPAYNVGTAVDRRVYFEFPNSQLVITGQVASFVQRRGAKRQPYVYFSASSYDDITSIGSHASLDGSIVMPYFATSATTALEQAENFQIIAAGVDGEFGSTGNLANRSTEDNDNLCSFSDGRLEKVLN